MKRMKVALSDEVVADLDRVSEQDGRSRAATVRDAVTEMLREREVRQYEAVHGPTPALPRTDG